MCENNPLLDRKVRDLTIAQMLQVIKEEVDVLADNISELEESVEEASYQRDKALAGKEDLEEYTIKGISTLADKLKFDYLRDHFNAIELKDLEKLVEGG